MIGAAMGLISTIMGLIQSSQANKKSQEELDALSGKQAVPPSVRAGEAIMRDQAYGDMPGFQNNLNNIDASQAQTINEAKDYVSGGGLISAISNMYTKANEAKRGVYDTNAKYQVDAKNRLASYLGQVSGGAERQLMDDQNSIALSKIGIDQAKTQDQLNFTNQGLNAIGNDRGLLAMINKLLGNSGGGTVGSNQWTPQGGKPGDYVGTSNNYA